MTQNYKEIEDYILQGIDGGGYGKSPDTTLEKLQFLHETFMAEYGWRVKQAGLLIGVTDWLSGLPSSCNIEWRNHLILNLAHKWKILDEKARESETDHFLDKWFKFMAMRILSLWAKHGIS